MVAGTFALALGLVASITATALWLTEAVHGRAAYAARQANWLMLAGAVGAAVVIEVALVRHDFAVRFVAENGSRSTPLYYTVTSLWSSLDGSLMLWLIVLTGYVVVLAMRPPAGTARLHPWAMVVLAVVAAFFFGLALFSGHAFDTVNPVPANGPGPNPLLQDHPAMGIHPPLLYTGFVGMAVPFAFAVAALITGDVGRAWLAATRRYTLFAWIALTAGIAMGAWWSYAVLGWGGYWAWDPVENASLLPWLVATALLHSAMVQRRRSALPAWNIALAVSAFLLVCLGTFLTRSDVLASVHSFTQSSIGPALLGLVVGLGAAVAGLVVFRAGRLGAAQPTGPLLSRSTALLLNNVLLVCLAFTVLLGTLFPLIAQIATGQELSVGPPYFDRIAVPISLVILLLMAVGPGMRWSAEDPGLLLRRFAPAVAIGGCTVAVLALLGVRGAAPLLAFGLAATVATTVIADWLGQVAAVARRSGRRRLPAAFGRLARQRRRNGGLLAHLGVAVVVVGIAGSSAYTTSAEHQIHIGQQIRVNGVTATLVGVGGATDANTMTATAHLRVRGAGRARTMAARLEFYPTHDTTVTRPAVHSSPAGDVYVTLLAISGDHRSATIRLAWNPLVGWIWAGAALTVLGGILTGWPGRRRVTASTTVPSAKPEPVAAVQ